MTSTIQAESTQTDLQVIISPPTIADAQLIVQLMQVNAANGADEGWHLLRLFEKPPTLSQLRRKYAPGTADYRHVSAFLASCETLGTFVKQGILNAALVHDMFWVAGAWQYSEKICKALRKEAGEPRLYENFELLAANAV